MASMTRILTVTLLLIASIAAGAALGGGTQPTLGHQSAPLGSSAEGFETFWPVFRDALLSGNAKIIEGMTRLPLQAKGELDRDPIRLVKPAELLQILQRLMDADTGLSIRKPITNRMLIERVESPLHPAPGVIVTSGFVRIGALAFEQGASGWRLRTIYLSED